MKPSTALLAAMLCWGLAHPGHAADAVRYVRDWMSVPLRESPARDSAVINPGLVSGTAVTLLETDEASGLSRVRTESGVVGWLPTRYLTAEPVARIQLEKARAELEEQRRLIAQLRGGQPAVAAAIDEANRRAESLQQANAALNAELTSLRQSPDNADNLKRSNQALQTENAALRQQLDQATRELATLRENRENEMFRNGALAVLGGVLIALLVPRLRPKKKSEWA